MKRIRLMGVTLAVTFLAAACSTQLNRRTTEGALAGCVLGGAAGAIVGKIRGAGVGCALGAGVGAVVGVFAGTEEVKASYAEPQPLPWMSGKTVRVVPGNQHGYSYYGLDVTRPIVEDQLRRRGAEILDKSRWRKSGSDYREPYRGDRRPDNTAGASDFVAEISAIEKQGGVIVDIRVISRDGRVRAIGSGQRYFRNDYHYAYTGDLRVEALRAAANSATWALH